MSRSLLAAGAALALAVAAPAQTDLGPLNLPNATTGLPLAQNFDALAGTVPPYMALTNLEVATLTADPEAWCNIGQLGACMQPYSGAYNLEMGMVPGLTSYHDVRNAMVLAIDPGSYSGSMTLSGAFIDGGEESDVVDGIWVSADGAAWYAVTPDWGNFIGVDNVWVYSGAVALDSTPVDTSQPFYLAFVQEDNFPYLDLDGIGIDDLAIPHIPAPPYLEVGGLAAGQWTTMSVESGHLNRPCRFMASRNGPGPTTIGPYTFDLSAPILTLADVSTDINGLALNSQIVPANTTGLQLWFQAAILDATGLVVISNGVTDTVL